MDTRDGFTPTVDDLDGLAASSKALAMTATDPADIEFWSTYAKGIAREAVNAALGESVWIETSTESDTFRSMKLAAIRKDVAYSWEATR